MITTAPLRPPRRKRIGVLLPAGCRGEALDMAINQAIMLKLGSEAAGEGAQIVVSCGKSDSDTLRRLGRLTDNGISLRETNWQPISKDELRVASKYLGDEYQLDAREYVYPSDGASNFLDCEFWYVIADRSRAPLAPIRPYAIFVNDCLQRYLPELLGDDCGAGFIATARRSALALCATPFTRDDLIQYVGLPARKIALIPPVFNPVELPVPVDGAWPRATPSRAYFMWLTDLSPPGNHEIALRGIRRYLERMDGQLDVVVAGFHSDRFNPETEPGEVSAHVRRVRLHLQRSKVLTERMRWPGTPDHDEYARILSGARFLFHPSSIDGGTQAAAEAAGLGVPTLSNDYPPMRYYDREMRLEITFFDGADENAIAGALKDAESRLTELKRRLPIPADLAQFDPRTTAPSLWKAVRQHV